MVESENHGISKVVHVSQRVLQGPFEPVTACIYGFQLSSSECMYAQRETSNGQVVS